MPEERIESDHNKDDATDDKRQGEAQPPPQVAPIRAVVETPVKQPDPASHEQQVAQQNPQKQPRPASWPPIWFLITETIVGVGLIAFAGGQMLVGYWQWDATNKQWAVMVSDQRPWISITEPTMEGFSLEDINLGRPAIARFKLSNTGKTPAMIVEGNIELVLYPRRASTDDLMGMVDKKRKPGGREIVVPPNSSVPYRITLDEPHHRIDPKMFDDPMPGEQDHGALWLAGRLHYLDAAGHRYPPLECCYRYDIQEKAFTPEGPHNRMN